MDVSPERFAELVEAAYAAIPAELTTLLDHALSVIAWKANERKPCITVALDVQFLAPARPGDFVVAAGRIVRQTSSLVFMQGSLTLDGQEIATASAILKVK